MILSDMLKELEADNKRAEEAQTQRHEREVNKIMGQLRKWGFVKEDGWALLPERGRVCVTHSFFKNAVFVGLDSSGYRFVGGEGQSIIDRLDVLQELIDINEGGRCD